MSDPTRSEPGVVASGLFLLVTATGVGLLLLRGLGIPLADFLALGQAFGSSYTLRVVTTGAAFVGILGGVLGSFAVLRGQSLLGDAVSHSALPGIYLAFGLWSVIGAEGVQLMGAALPAARSLPVVLSGALATGGLAALGVLLISRATRLKEDAALGLMLSTFFGAGLVLRSILQQGASKRAGLEGFLFGTAATISASDAMLMGATTALVLVIVALLWKELQLLAFDPDYLATLGFPVRFIDLVLTGLIVVSVIAGLQVVGVILMSSMLIAPAVAARQWTDRLSVMVALAAGFGLIASFLGVGVSYLRAGIATGPVIALFVTSLALASLLLAPRRGLAWAWLKRRLRNRAFRIDTLLLHLDDQDRALAQDMLRAQLGWSRLKLRQALQMARKAEWIRLDGEQVALTPRGHARAVSVLENLGQGASEALLERAA